MSEDDLRKLILSRRAKLVAAALVGTAIATTLEACVCLSVAADPPPPNDGGSDGSHSDSGPDVIVNPMDAASDAAADGSKDGATDGASDAVSDAATDGGNG